MNDCGPTPGIPAPGISGAPGGPGRDGSGAAPPAPPHHPSHELGEEAALREEDLPRLGALAILLIALVMVALFAALFLLGWMPRSKREAELDAAAAAARTALPRVEVARPQQEAAIGNLSLPGNTMAFQETAVYPRATGYLSKLHVDIGDRVTAGKLLAEIAAPEVDAQLEQARATAEQAAANATRAKNDLELADATYQRYEGFAKAGGVTRQQLDERRAALNQARAASAAATANVAAAKAEVERLTSLQGFQKVTAPFAGTVTARNYDVGALLNATSSTGGRELIRLAQVDPMRVFVDVPQAYVNSIQIGDAANLSVRNYPGRAFVGKVARSTGAVDQTTRTVRTELHFANPDGALYPGMYGTIRFDIHRPPRLLAPTSALIYGPAGLQVAVVQDGKVHLHQVTVGHDYGTRVEVTTGLAADEMLVINPGERLAEGVAVEASTAPTTAPAAGREGPRSSTP